MDVAGIFVIMGIWAGFALTSRRKGPPFLCNETAEASLGVTPSELDVLDRLALGEANKEIARRIADVEAAVQLNQMPLFRFAVSVLEIFTVAILVSLGSALTLKNHKTLPATTA